MKSWAKQRLSLSRNVMISVLCTYLLCPVLGCGEKEMETKKGNSVSEEIYVDSPKTALLIIDIQNDYFPEGKFELTASMEASVQAKKALAFFRQNGLHVIHIQHETTQDPAPFFAPNTEGQKIHENVLPVPDEPVFTKHLVSSFEQTPLLEHLRKNEIKRLVIVGMQTNVCVFGTVKDGLKNEFEIIVLKDATAAVDLSIHTETLTAIEADGAKLASVDDLTMK